VALEAGSLMPSSCEVPRSLWGSAGVDLHQTSGLMRAYNNHAKFALHPSRSTLQVRSDPAR